MSYALERLFVDQDRDWVVDTIPSVLAWVPGTTKALRTAPYRFAIAHTKGKSAETVDVDLTWDENKLSKLVPGLRDTVRRLTEGRTAQREHVTELAAYGLALVGISVLMPSRRVQHMQMGVAPDMLFDVTPSALRGVEVAGRTSGGRSALLTVRNGAKATKTRQASKGKADQLRARKDILEVHLSLWSASPRISMMEQLKP